MRRLLVALALVLVAGSALRADDDENPPPLKVTEADYATYSKLRFEDAVFDEHKLRTRDPKMSKKVEATRDKAWKDSGWDRTKFDSVRGVIDEVLSLLEQEKGEGAEDARASLKEKDATTVATVRAHAKEIADYEELRKKVEARFKEDLVLPAPDPKDVDGTWTLDLEKTVDRMSGGVLKGEDRAKMMDKLKGDTSAYTFSGGKSFVLVEEHAGKKSEIKGTYRVEGRKIFLKDEKRDKEKALDLGWDDGCLVVGSGFAQGVFTKKK